MQYVDHEHTDDPEGIVIYATYDRPTNTLTPLQTFEDSGAGWFRIRQDPDAAPSVAGGPFYRRPQPDD